VPPPPKRCWKATANLEMAAILIKSLQEEQMKKKQVVPKEKLRSQVKRLANFIMARVPGEPSKSQGAIDTAIRIIEAGLAPEVKVGDVVRLKSGGAEMTVAEIRHGLVDCVWMGGYEKAISSSLVPAIVLSVVEKKKTQIQIDEGFKTKMK